MIMSSESTRKVMNTGVFMRKRKAFWGTGILLCALFLLCCTALADEPVLNRSKVRLTVNNAFVLRVKNAEGEVKWKNSNKKVLKVVYSDSSRIVVKARKPGTAKIRCRVDGISKVCRFTVKAVKGIPKKMTVIEGDKVWFRQNDKTGKWKSSDEKIAKISGNKKARSKKIRFRDVGTVKITEKIGKKKYTCKVTVLTKEGYKTRPVVPENSASGETGQPMTRVWRFILNLYEISQQVDADIAAGITWAYYNTSSHRSATTFEETRAQGKTWTNCMGGVTFALRLHDLVGPEGVRWFGAKGGVNWFGAQAEADARRYFDVIPVFKKVQDGIADNSIQPGDILIYKSMVHVNVYVGNMLSFDTGHAFCSRSGEGAPYERWMGPTPYLNYTCCYVMRLKEVVDPPVTVTAQ